MSKTIAIDLDGVIFDTERYFRVASEIEDVNKYGLNNKIDNRNVRFQDRYNWDKDFEESFYAKNVYDFEERSGIMPGANYVLSYLKSRGYKLYVITARGFFSQKQVDLTNSLLKRYDLYNMFEKIRSIISEQLSIDDVDTITLDTSLTEDLEADSLDAVEVIMALEDEFGIEIPDEEAEHFKTIGDICKFIENNK